MDWKYKEQWRDLMSSHINFMQPCAHFYDTPYLLSLQYLSMSRGTIALTPYWDPTMKTETWPQNYLNKLKLYSDCHHILNKKDCLAASTFYWKRRTFQFSCKKFIASKHQRNIRLKSQKYQNYFCIIA